MIVLIKVNVLSSHQCFDMSVKWHEGHLACEQTASITHKSSLLGDERFLKQ